MAAADSSYARYAHAKGPGSSTLPNLIDPRIPLGLRPDINALETVIKGTRS